MATSEGSQEGTVQRFAAELLHDPTGQESLKLLLLRDDDTELFDLINEYMFMGELRGDLKRGGERLADLASTRYDQERYEEALVAAFMAMNLYQTTGLLYRTLDCQMLIGYVLKDQGRQAAAALWFSDARDAAVRNEADQFALPINILLAECFVNLGWLSLARSRYQSALSLLSPEHSRDHHVGVHNSLARVCLLLGDELEARIHFDQAGKSHHDPTAEAFYRMNVAAELIQLHQHEHIAVQQAQSAIEVLGSAMPEIIAAGYYLTGEAELALGNPQDAETAFASALAFYDSAGDSEGSARAHLALGMLPPEATEDWSIAAEHLVTALTNLPSDSALELASAAMRLGAIYVAMGRDDLALPHFERGLTDFRKLGDAESAAQCNIIIGGILSNTGAYRSALGHFRDARDHYEGTGDFPRYAHTEFHLARCLTALSASPLALIHFAKAHAASLSTDDARQQAQCAEFLGQALRVAGHIEMAAEVLTEARGSLEQLGDSSGARRVEISLALILGKSDVEGALKELSNLEAYFVSERQMQSAAYCAESMGQLSTDVQTQLAHTKRSVEHFRAADDVHGTITSQLKLATLLAELGSSTAALAIAVDATLFVEESASRLRDFSRRGEWRRQWDRCYDVLLPLAIKEKQLSLVIEISERGRLQGAGSTLAEPEDHVSLQPLLVPEPDPFVAGLQHLSPETNVPPDIPAEPPPSNAPMAVGDSSSLPLPLVTVAGRSVLADLRPDLRSRPTCAIEKSIGLVGGERAWFLCYSLTSDELIRTLLLPNGRIVVDAIQAGARSTFRYLMTSYAETLRRFLAMGSHTGDIAEVARDEERLAQELGESLVPPLLGQELYERLARREALSLVVSLPPELLGLSLGLVGIPVSQGTNAPLSDMKRILEGAIVRILPPCSLVKAAGGGGAGREQGFPLPLKIAVIDPLDDLPRSRWVPKNAEKVLVGRSMLERAEVGQHWLLATKSALAETLRPPAGAPGVLIYSGHAVAADNQQTVGAALPLADKTDRVDSTLKETHDNLLSDKDLLVPHDELKFPLPSRVFLAGCGTVGGPDSTGRETISLVPAILWAGASLVVATHWATLDNPDTASLERQITDRLLASDDMGRALRDLQLEHLYAWNAAGSRRRQTGLALHPFVWGGYTAIGSRER